jgi:hypothetical protein
VPFSKTEALGVYTATWGAAEPNQTQHFAVNVLNRLESDLAPVTQFQVGALTITTSDTRRVPLELWKVLVGLGLAVALLEWWIYNRRVQI